MSYHCYAIRRLNPFQGVTQIVQIGGARAFSRDGRVWEIQVEADRPGDLWSIENRGQPVTQYLRFGLWSPADGFKQAPAHPLLDFAKLLSRVEGLLSRLRSATAELPFPLEDRYELWLLDGEKRTPLALLASAADPCYVAEPLSTRWQCADRSHGDFESPETDRCRPAHPLDTNPHPHMSTLENLVRNRGGHTLVQWFERDPQGGGEALHLPGAVEYDHPSLPASSFPPLLLSESWEAYCEQRLVADYLSWLSPVLLTLQGLPDPTRYNLEQQARSHALRVEALWPLYPRILDQSAINASRVEAKLRKTATPDETTER